MQTKPRSRRIKADRLPWCLQTWWHILVDLTSPHITSHHFISSPHRISYHITSSGQRVQDTVHSTEQWKVICMNVETRVEDGTFKGVRLVETLMLVELLSWDSLAPPPPHLISLTPTRCNTYLCTMKTNMHVCGTKEKTWEVFRNGGNPDLLMLLPRDSPPCFCANCMSSRERRRAGSSLSSGTRVNKQAIRT